MEGARGSWLHCVHALQPSMVITPLNSMGMFEQNESHPNLFTMHRWIGKNAGFAVYERLNDVGNDLEVLPHLTASALRTLCFNSHRTPKLTLNLSSYIFFSHPKKNVQEAVIYLYISCNYDPTSFSKLTFSVVILAKNGLGETKLTRVGSSWSLLGLLLEHYIDFALNVACFHASSRTLV